MKPPSLPPLDQLAAAVRREEIPALIVALTARLLTEQPSVVSRDDYGNGPDDELLTCAQAAKALHRSERWIWRRAHSLPFVHRPDHKRGMWISKKAMLAWATGRKVK